MNTLRAFTLIELLITVAILAILAAIAVPNFLEAQTRAKVSRVHSDFRTLATALESYRVDEGAYPIAAKGDQQLDQPLAALTSPVAYITAIPGQPFGESLPMGFNPALSMRGYQYKDRATTSVGIPGETYGHIWLGLPDRSYLLHSCGPNRVWDVLPYVEYDPTNGTTSDGDISRFGPF